MTTTMNLSPELVLLDQQFADETAAITAAGQLLVDHGYVEAGYIDSMQERHALSTVYIGNHVAIPHGTESAKSQVNKAMISSFDVAATIRSTFSSSEQMTAIFDNNSRCSSPTPAIPMTSRACSVPNATPCGTCRIDSPVFLTCDLAASVPWGIATWLPI